MFSTNYRTLILFFFIFISQYALSQRVTLSGYIRDAANGEELIGANIYIEELKQGTSTNNYGYYSLTIEKGSYSVMVSFVGYDKLSEKIKLEKNIKRDFELKELSLTTDEVIINATRTDKNVQSSDFGVVDLQVETIKNLPAFLGEVDILKTIQLLPGVSSAGEGNTGYYVRGGGPDQNLILLDEATVYNASHLFGFFSIFNADAVKDVSLTKGGMPAYYGGRLSSVLDISMKNGNSRDFEVDGGIGLISSRLTVQGPIKPDTCSFIISGRRTYIDVLAGPFIPKTSEFKGSGYFFYDLNMKVNYRFSENDRLYLSAYYGRDKFTFNNKKAEFDVNIPWGNAMVSLRWNHLFSNKLFFNTTAILSDYQFQFDAEQEDFAMKLFSGITDLSFKADLTYLASPKHTLRAGAIYTYHKFTPSSLSARIGALVIDPDNLTHEYGLEGALYINDEFDLGERFRVNAGIRATLFEQIGPFDRYNKNERGQTIDTLHFAKGDKVVTYKNIEPRLSLRLMLTGSASIKASYTQNYQYIHLASFSSVSLPTDVWIPSSTIIKPQFGTQYAAGFFKNFKNNGYETSIEVYYKTLENQIDYKDGATPGDNIGDNADNNFTLGEGESFGIEFFFKKKYGKTTGWIGYTLAKTHRRFDAINDGKYFPAKYDRRHDLSLVVTHELNSKWSFSGVFIYATGNAITLALSRYTIESAIITQDGSRNGMRMAPYHRLDLSATYTLPKKRKYQSSWNFSIYNAYNRYNPYFIYFDTEGSITQGDFKTRIKQVSLFPILPSVTWNFSF